MAVDQELVSRIRASLSFITDLEEKTMFRGLTFMVNQKMCICVSANDVMFRINPKEQQLLLDLKNCEVMVSTGREYKGYLIVQKEDLKGPELDFWIAKAIDFNKEAKSSRRPSKK